MIALCESVCRSLEKNYDMSLMQTEVNKVYPYKYSSSMATCLVGGFVTAFVGVVVRRDGDAWKLGWNLKLLTVVYSVSHQIISAGGTETKCFA